jgi:glucose/arabinose dehydrogenase/mono/diheme cytochrome c family protein
MLPRMNTRYWLALGATCLLSSHAVADGNAIRGKTLFKERCSVCHSAEPDDGGGAQGPSLINLMGRPAATSRQFSYTAALRGSHLTWDSTTLDHFLAAPSALVPGTAMVIAVDQASDRSDLIAYFQSLPKTAAPGNDAAINVPVESRRTADWSQDAPGRVHHITVASLPPSYATKSATNRSRVVDKAAGATLSLPSGFHIDIFAGGFTGPRKMLVASNGDILLTETAGGKVSVLHPSPDGAHAAKVDTFASGLKQPFGLAFYPDAKSPQWLYVAETNRVVRYAYRTGDTAARGAAEVVIPELPSGSGHFTRDIAFSADGRHLWVSVGSGSNVAETMSKKTPAEIKSWEAERALGASWDTEDRRATVLEFDAAKPGAPRIYATGIRNCVGLTVQPSTHALWCTTNERDALGDDLVPDYSTRVLEGHFYGWPWYYIGDHEDPRHKGERPDLAGKVSVPDVLYQAHSASLNLMFYSASAGKSAFPAQYVGDAFVTFHGSWNRSLRTGYKIVRLRMAKGEPTGEYEDFLTGFVVDNESVWGRPVGLVELSDGSVLMSEDGNNQIYRISYSK